MAETIHYSKGNIFFPKLFDLNHKCTTKWMFELFVETQTFQINLR